MWLLHKDKFIMEIESPNIIHIGKKYIVELAATAEGTNETIHRKRDLL